MHCLIKPMGKFGDHDKGLSGCLWCEHADVCIDKNPNKGGSLLFKKTPLIKKQFRVWKGGGKNA